MEPFYFGASAEPLFGIYHPPTSEPQRNAGVLLCYPIGHEYIMAHRAYRQLSIRLAEAGFHVLRFDYYATGDSSGECEHGSPRRWLRDISTAIGELRLRSGSSKVCLVGCRLGATLSALVAADRGDIEHIVLWDPIPNGKAYIDELTLRQQEMLQRTHVRPLVNSDRGDTREFLGFAMTETVLSEIEAIDLLAMRQQPAQHLLIIESLSDDTTSQLREHLTTLDSRVVHQHIPIPNAWTWNEDVGTILVPYQILNSVVSWTVQVHP
jgi:alpha/beta superfamily hydrolase